MRNASITSGMNLRAALSEASRMGCSVRTANRTGEIVVTHSSWNRKVRLNLRRKDSPRQLTHMLQKMTHTKR